MKQLPMINIDTPAIMTKKDAQLKQNNGNYFMANKVKLISLSEKRHNKQDHCLKRSLSYYSSSFSNITQAVKFNKNRSITNLEQIKPLVHYSTLKPELLSNTPTTAALKDNSNRIVYKDQLIMSQSTLSSNGAYSLVDPNKIHLFVKAGQDGKSQGACPFCQDVFIQLLLKAQSNRFNFDVITINLDNPPREFKELSIKPPVLIHGSSSFLDENLSSNDDETKSQDSQTSGNAVILSDVDEIAEYLDRLYPNTKITAENSQAKRVCLNVYSKFSFFIRDIASKSTSLEAELEKIDNYLRDNTDNENKFLNGKTMSGLDCSLLPKLHHIRIAAENIKKFKIPYRFRYLWRYLHNAYQTDAFQKSCPPDREIIWHWSKTNISNKELLMIMQETAYKTTSIPEDLQI